MQVLALSFIKFSNNALHTCTIKQYNYEYILSFMRQRTSVRYTSFIIQVHPVESTNALNSCCMSCKS